MKVGIVGLGLIGGSLAKAVTAFTAYEALGYDADKTVTQKAKTQGVISGEINSGNIADCGFVLIALYPDDVITYCTEHFKHMKPGTIIVDCAGVKSKVCAGLPALAEEHRLRFVGGHPMAGVERSGFDNAFAELFAGATMILCRDGVPDESGLAEISVFFLKLGFGRVKLTTAREHDEVIAYTSQLAHLVSSAYIKGGTREKRYGFSAGSFKDLTRVARLNEHMWTELFMENKANLIRETDEFIQHVTAYRDALAAADSHQLKELLRNGTQLKICDEAGEMA